MWLEQKISILELEAKKTMIWKHCFLLQEKKNLSSNIDIFKCLLVDNC